MLNKGLKRIQNPFIFIKCFSSKIHPEIVDKFVKIKAFKSIMNEILENKIFHFAILRYDVKELVCLQKETWTHLRDLESIKGKYQIPLESNRLNKISSKFLVVSTLSLTYSDFLEFIKISHEKLEEETNDLIRLSLELDQFPQDEIMNDFLKRIRDRWRGCFGPEVLDENKQPLANASPVSQLIISLNNNVLGLLI